MERFLRPYSGYLYSMMRIVAGFLFTLHGAQKLFGAFDSEAASLGTLRGVAGIIEFFGGLLIAGGLFTSLTAFIASGQMAVAYFMSHAPRGFWPNLNRGELAALYCFVFLFIAAYGPGPWSLDALRRRRPSGS